MFPRTVSELESAAESASLPLSRGIGSLSVFSNNQEETITVSNSEESDSKKQNEPIPPMDERAIEEDLKIKILERLQASPKKGFRVVQDWLDELETRVAEG